ncbi:hypothetical protein LCGC14_0730820 [marine sediment metagenome]|uniref:Uncharacterized protein n=1 Tax=marine sediment metagenome TaxID=412755 RepID=A0A0F9TGX1_9ZZZZ
MRIRFRPDRRYHVVRENDGLVVWTTDNLTEAKGKVARHPNADYIFDTETEVDIFTEDGGLSWETSGDSVSGPETLTDILARQRSEHTRGVIQAIRAGVFETPEYQEAARKLAQEDALKQPRRRRRDYGGRSIFGVP